jgi:hypothetical protein
MNADSGPPDVIAAARARGSRKGLQDMCHRRGNTDKSYRTAGPYTVVAISRHGARIVAGRFASLELAERNAAILRKLAFLTGGDARVEHEGMAP